MKLNEERVERYKEATFMFATAWQLFGEISQLPLFKKELWPTPFKFKQDMYIKMGLPRGKKVKNYSMDQILDLENHKQAAEEIAEAYKRVYEGRKAQLSLPHKTNKEDE